MKHLPVRELGYALGFLWLIAAIYMGGYYAIVERHGFTKQYFSPGSSPEPAVFPTYRLGSADAKVFFGPAHAIDLRLRPEYWTEEAYLEALTQELGEFFRESP